MTTKPTVLIIRDGWGENHDSSHASFNAVLQARTPVSERLSKEWPRTELLACGRDVGLPEGIMGNSEVGHQNIGAGRIVDQELVRIDKAFETGAVDANPQIEGIFAHLQKTGGRLHLMGLVSDAGVHAMLEHLCGLLGVCKRRQFNDVFVHAFTDGRDTPPFSGKGYIEAAEAKIREIGVGKLASVAGRFWAMDRDLRWDRVQAAYDALTGRAAKFTARSATEAVEFAYNNPIDEARKGDEFVVPTMVVDDSGKPVGIIRDGDAVIFFNFRGDRPRELTRAFIEENFDGFERGPRLDIHYATMTNYQKGLCPNVIFDKPPKMPDILGAWVAAKGIGQFRCAETEKFPHVTFFFNDYREEPFDGEDREMLQSPKDVSTYDQKPEMAAIGVKEATKKAILSGKYGLIVVNFANADMVGHTGVFEAAVKACEVVDAAVGELLEAIDQVGGNAVITADHGNSDQMWDPDGNGAHTAHTLNPVELVVYGEGLKGKQLKSSGRLADIAPTVLALMGLEQPEAMTGDNLLQG